MYKNKMERFILTGAPGSGKTALILYSKSIGYSAVEEAATDVIISGQANGNPALWRTPAIIEKIVHLQGQRRKKLICHWLFGKLNPKRV